MTGSPRVSPLACRTLDEAVAALRGRGLRLTTTRKLVLQGLFDSAGPVSSEQVARQLGMDLSTVYRNFEEFERQGLVRHVHLGHGPGLYALAGQGELEYLCCEECGAVTAVPPQDLDPVRDIIAAGFGYSARFTHFAIMGTCPSCSERGPASGASASGASAPDGETRPGQ